MAWREDVLAVLAELPARFRLEDVYRFAPRLYAGHPENNHLREKIRQILQQLRDDGKIRFLDNEGTYENQLRDTQLRDVIGLVPGQLTSREELAQLLEMRSEDPLRRGIFRRAKGPLRNHIFLFHDERLNPYGDRQEGSTIRYVGQGMKGDQELAHFNRTLAEHLDNNMRVHYFVQPRERPGEIRYEGEVVLKELRRVFRPEEQRSVLEYTLVPAPAGKSLESYGQIFEQVLEDRRPLSLEDRGRELVAYQRVLRDRAFRSIVLRAYSMECAVCGEPIHKDEALELEAAHIVPVAERGPDRVENGLSLCVRHHWAFDSGVFALSDDYRISWLGDKPDPHGEVKPGEQIQLPRLDEQWPAHLFLRMHRAKWSLAS